MGRKGATVEIYWRLEDIPELKCLDKAERSQVWAATVGQRFRDPFMLLLLVLFFLIVSLGNHLGGLLIPVRFGSAVGGGLGAGLAASFYVIASYHRCRPYFAEEIRRRSQRSGTWPRK
jgi:hypothetical protein